METSVFTMAMIMNSVATLTKCIKANCVQLVQYIKIVWRKSILQCVSQMSLYKLRFMTMIIKYNIHNTTPSSYKTDIFIFLIPEGTAGYAGLLLVPEEGFGQGRGFLRALILLGLKSIMKENNWTWPPSLKTWQNLKQKILLI